MTFAYSALIAPHAPVGAAGLEPADPPPSGTSPPGSATASREAGLDAGRGPGPQPPARPPPPGQRAPDGTGAPAAPSATRRPLSL